MTWDEATFVTVMGALALALAVVVTVGPVSILADNFRGRHPLARAILVVALAWAIILGSVVTVHHYGNLPSPAVEAAP